MRCGTGNVPSRRKVNHHGTGFRTSAAEPEKPGWVSNIRVGYWNGEGLPVVRPDKEKPRKLTGIGRFFIVVGALSSAFPWRVRITGKAVFYFGLIFLTLDLISTELKPLSGRRQVRDFAKALGRLAKTDALDAGILADFAQRIRPEARPLPDEVGQQSAIFYDPPKSGPPPHIGQRRRRARPNTSLRDSIGSASELTAGALMQSSLSARPARQRAPLPRPDSVRCRSGPGQSWTARRSL